VKWTSKGINASVNIEIDKMPNFHWLSIKQMGFPKIKGEAQLNGGIDPSGKRH
jgi:hypothetical protein